MAKLLVVDDDSANRALIATVLGHAGHAVLQASDGADGLKVARAENPELIISDILMPTMDGYEFVRQLRASADFTRTRVIFYTAHFHERQARNLAATCGVSRVLLKSCEPQEILRIVDEVLAGTREGAPVQTTQEFDRAHLRLLTDKLSAKADELTFVNGSLAALIDFNLQLSSERNPQAMLEKVCRAARNLIGAKFGFLTVRHKTAQKEQLFATSGIDSAIVAAAGPVHFESGPLTRVLSENCTHRFSNASGDPASLGLPVSFPPVHCLVAAPVASLKSQYGWLCLADKLGADSFSAEDERILSILGAQVGRIYENGSLYIQVERHAEQLLLEMAERERATSELRESERRFSDMLRNVRMISVMLDRQANITYCNDYLLKLTGWQRKDVVGGNWFDLFLPPEAGNMREVFAGLLEDQPNAWHHENEILTKSGEKRLIRWNNTVLRSVCGEVIGSASLGEDTTEHRRAIEELGESELRFRQLAENIHEVFFLTDPGNTQMLYISPAYERIWGRSCESVYARPASWGDSTHPEDLERVAAGQLTMSEHGQMSYEYRIIRPDGAVRWIWARGFPIRNERGEIYRVAGLAEDITDKKEQQDRIARLSRIYAVLSGINSAIVRIHERGQLLQEACRIAVEEGAFRASWVAAIDPETLAATVVASFGASPEYLAQLRVNACADADRGNLPSVRAAREMKPVICNDIAADATLEPLRSVMLAGGMRSGAAFPLIVDGRAVAVLALLADETHFFDDQELHLLNELAGDIAFGLQYIAKDEKLSYLAYYDALTGLANRTFFHEKLVQYVSEGNRSDRKFALVVADLERFEAINDTFGRHAGDQLLRQVAERFVKCVGDAKEVARIAPDHFAVVIPDVRAEDDVARAVEHWLSQWLDEPFQIDGGEIRISAKAGIALFPGDGRDGESLLKNAEAALKKAKATGEKHLFYTPHLSDRISERLALENSLRRALENEEFMLHYQPKVDLETRRLEGVEALIRWQSPELGLVPPMKFIPLMEETGIIIEVGLWVLRQACVDRSRWLEKRAAAPRIAVNVSTVQLRKKDFVRQIEQIVRIAGSEAGIDIEVTESLIMDDVESNIEKLRAIRDLGVGIAIDDFGTGYSSLGYLAKLPADTLKIDRSFTAAMLDDPSIMTLVSTMITLAHSLKLTVVAEGVESEEQAKILRLLRCDQMQGFLISKPLSFEDMTTYLARSRN
jgi:diguanylate cyclase (GGDEF)-like protein/PAS domain S-box-containing protein